MTEFVEIAKKYGATGLLAVAVWWQNSRINDIESRLHACYEARIMENGRTSQNHQQVKRLLAILPKREKYLHL